MKRRDLAHLLWIPAGVHATAQTPRASGDATQARETVARNVAELRKYAVPMAMEPAFVFKA
jgi:hypothetical protein